MSQARFLDANLRRLELLLGFLKELLGFLELSLGLLELQQGVGEERQDLSGTNASCVKVGLELLESIHSKQVQHLLSALFV